MEEMRLEVFKVVERRGRAIYKTQKVGDIWVLSDIEENQQKLQAAQMFSIDMADVCLSPPSTNTPYEQCYRKVQ